jgi:glyoxylase-like metal-dependent hydrolase (beta-lactamase superfamily II)
MSEPLIHVNGPAWYFPADGGDRVEPNVGVIATSWGSVLVDAGNSPQHARCIREALEAAGLPPVTHVIYTHHHWDHVFGAQVFPATIIAHQLCYDQLAERAERTWSNTAFEEERRRNPALESIFLLMQRAVGDFDGFKVIVPSVTFTKSLTLYVGDVRLDIEHVGGKHALDSIVVRVPQAQVAYVGDSYYGPVLLRPMMNGGIDRDIVRRLLEDENTAYFIDGHKPVIKTREQFMVYAAEPAKE